MNSKFKKLLITLIIILIIEFFIILISYTNSNFIKHDNSLETLDKNTKYIIVIDLPLNEMTVFKNNKKFKKYIIASGKPSTPSPIGTWTITSKGTWGKSFGGHWMGLNVPWGKYGIHGTSRPNSIGFYSSHGCIRMRNKDIAKLYKITPYGTKVIIYGGPYGNFGDRFRELKPGMTGSDVYEVQKILNKKGYYKSSPNGIYNEYLKFAVHKFQKENSLPISDTLNLNFYKKLNIFPFD